MRDPLLSVRGISKRMLLVALIAVGVRETKAQLPAGTTDASQSSSSSSQNEGRVKPDPRRAEAAAALDKKDYPTALRLLTALTAENPRDARSLYDLGYTQESMEQDEDAAKSYQAAAAADPAFFEPHLALGLLLARQGRMSEAHDELQAAVKLTPATEPEFKGRAWRAMARIDERNNPELAREELLTALKDSPETPEDTLMTAELAERLGEDPGAEAAYRSLLKKQPGDAEATAALAHLLLKENKAAEAEPLLEEAVAKQPNDVALNAELANTYAADLKVDKALVIVEKLHAEKPGDATVARLYARLETATGNYSAAEPVWSSLIATYPNDPVLVDDRADALIHLKRFAEAEALLKKVLAQPSRFSSKEDLGNAASHLAYAASEQKDPQTTLQALQMRANVFPPSASTLYLEATANDELHHVKEASSLYKQFLSSSNGKFPDEEWQARHRLVTLEHMR